MPKISWKVPEKPKPKPNALKELFKSYMKQQKLTAEKMAPRMNTNVSCFRKEITRPVGMWRLKEIEEYCRALKIPLEEALDAAARSL